MQLRGEEEEEIFSSIGFRFSIGSATTTASKDFPNLEPATSVHLQCSFSNGMGINGAYKVQLSSLHTLIGSCSCIRLSTVVA